MKDDLPFLYHILDEIAYIKRKTASLSCDEIRLDEDLSRSIPRSLEIIGEAVKNLSPGFREVYPDIPWSDIAGLWDKLIHGFFWDQMDHCLLGYFPRYYLS
nr:HepT-like ribonuclease domain-containing protein [uncultured Methanospirillum sp.]